MTAIELLKKYKRELDPIIKDCLDEQIEKARKVDPLAVDSIKQLKKFVMFGGKRLRPALTYYGYLSAGGKDLKSIKEASVSIELVHTFLLMHDDIIDRDSKRHNVDTIHEVYRKKAERHFPKIDSLHFGNSIAIIVGDITAAIANDIILSSKFSYQIIVKALRQLQEIVYQVVPGEMLDVYLEAKGKATEKEVMRMHEGKTARYTFEGPLHLGVKLAGNNDQKLIKAFTEYSIPLGIAFQIRDDILGIFGDEKKLGKPIASDIAEGKQTLLVVKALEKGSAQQKRIIKKYLGKEKINKQELEEFQKVVIDTGSLEYSQKMCEKLAQQSLRALDKINFKNQEAEVFLKGIAEYIINREK